LDYLASLARGQSADETASSGYSGRRLTLKTAMATIATYERELAAHLLEALRAHSDARVYGITDAARADQRVPTVVFSHARLTPRAVAERLAAAGIYVWDGNYYAQEIMERLGHGEHGMVRVGLAHYNTHAEIERFAAALNAL
jgi:selenocysteine lyase/cysteine desulfurase